MPSTYESTLAEAAYTIAAHGFAEEEAGTTDGDGWHALATVSPVLLRNVGEDALADALESEVECVAWIREDSDGHVGVVDSRPSHDAHELVQRFEHAARHLRVREGIREAFGYNYLHLASLADVAGPDSPTSPGARWLERVRDDVVARVDYLEGDVEYVSDLAWEIADAAVTIYTHERMSVLTDLALYHEDLSDLAPQTGEVTIVDLAGLAEYVAAERLATRLLEEMGLTD